MAYNLFSNYVRLEVCMDHLPLHVFKKAEESVSNEHAKQHAIPRFGLML